MGFEDQVVRRSSRRGLGGERVDVHQAAGGSDDDGSRLNRRRKRGRFRDSSREETHGRG